MAEKPKLNISQQNRVLILKFLQEQGAKSRVDIANAMQLTKAGITLITNDLIEHGVLCEKGIQKDVVQTKKVRGRRKILLDINENYRLVFGVAFEHDNISVGLTNLNGEALDHDVILLEGKSYYEVLEALVAAFNYTLQRNCITIERVLAFGICIGNKSGNIIDGATISDKLNRIKRDLAHAIAVPIYTRVTIDAALLAQMIFETNKSEFGNILMLRYGYQVSSGILANNLIYQSSNLQSSGFAAMNIDEKTGQNSYDVFLKVCSETKSNEEMIELIVERNQAVAKDIFTCSQVLNPDTIFLFGDYFEDESRLSEIKLVLRGTYSLKNKIEVPKVTTKTIYLAACAVAVQKGFYELGAY